MRRPRKEKDTASFRFFAILFINFQRSRRQRDIFSCTQEQSDFCEDRYELCAYFESGEIDKGTWSCVQLCIECIQLFTNASASEELCEKNRPAYLAENDAYLFMKISMKSPLTSSH